MWSMFDLLFLKNILRAFTGYKKYKFKYLETITNMQYLIL